MQLGIVVGHAVSTVKHPTLVGWRLLVVQSWTPDGQPDGEPLLAIDRLGCGLGGLRWADVRPRIERALDELPVRALVFEPHGLNEMWNRTRRFFALWPFPK